jgi:hypothetical protein
MPSNHPQSTIPTTRLKSSLLVRIAACVSAAILMLIFAIIVYLVSGVGQREFEPRFPPLLMIAWTSLWTVGAAALLLTRIGALAAPLPRWLLRVGPWVLAAFFACFAFLQFLSIPEGRSGDWQMDLQGPLSLLVSGLCIVVASEEPATH